MTWSITMADMRQEGFEEGLEQGREQGAYQNKLETAKTMLSLGLPLDQIQLCTSLSGCGSRTSSNQIATS